MLHRMGLFVLGKVRGCLAEVEMVAEKGDDASFVEAVCALDREVGGLVRIANSLREGGAEAGKNSCR